jgi:phenylpropionate dioxygenase-like ring-hydroxylating dioxygenase large terminal subunit
MYTSIKMIFIFLCIGLTPPSINWPLSWVPAGSVHEMHVQKPNVFKFSNQQFVCWKAKNDWNVFFDQCPHRLAPLSEGRIENGVLQCGYHGWKFDCKGMCRDIPQMDTNYPMRMMNTNARSCPTTVSNSIIWFWPWGISIPHDTKSPDAIMKDLNVVSTYTRNFPYDWASLMENVMDPSHIPFAHHGLQGNRNDAIPIKVNQADLKEFDYRVQFSDRTMSKNRIGVLEVHAPYFVNYVSKFENNQSFNLTVLCTPMEDGQSRVTLFTSNKKSKKMTLFQKLMKCIPMWVQHVMANRFLDSDLIFLHYQDVFSRQNSKYTMPAQSDIPIRYLQRLLHEYKYEKKKVIKSVSRRELLDRWHTHTLHCRHCYVAYKNFERLENASLSAFIILLLFKQYVFAAVHAIIYCILGKLKARFHHQDFQYTEM